MLPIPFGQRPLRFWQAAALFIVALLLFLVFLVFMVDSGNPADRDCRDDVLGQVPVYPQATLMNRDKSASKPAAGSEWREYQTADSVDVVGAFYREVASCADPDSGAEELSILCDGTLDSRHRVNYQARISRTEDMTSISMFVGWYCGTGD